MTDSESDASNNVFNFQNVNTTVNAKGPNINFSCRNPMTSMYNMSRNYERQRYAKSGYDQSSMYRRETSPMSIRSACDIQPLNFQHYAGMSSRQSLFNGRSGSPMSVRSIDSCASAVDIASAIKSGKFNKNDLRMIRDAYQKLLKRGVRQRIEKRRNRRLLLKGRRRSGYDSGHQASDSSVSSDDYRSVKTYKENMSSSRSARMDLTSFRKTFDDHNILKDSSVNFSQNTFKNKFSVGSSSVSNTQNFNNTVNSTQFNSMPTQKERFKNGFLLPSQRFNRSLASSAILESVEKPPKNTENNPLNSVRNHYAQNNHKKNNNISGSEEEEIFSEMTIREKSTCNIDAQRKRNLDSEDESILPVSKKSKIISPAKSAPYNKKAPPKLKNINTSNNNVELSNSFEFAKPSFPVRKFKLREVQEKLIAKSAQPLTDYLDLIPDIIREHVQILQPSNLEEKSIDNLTHLDQSETTQNSDVSSRPSFIKRKLFTQKLDVAEKANLSTDAASSPQSSVYTLQKEKNKSRKLVTNQSCLNREVEDDSNLLDLIHKIVPPDRMNLTNQTTINHSKNDVHSKDKKDKEAKWDVASVISMCNEDDVSDTYTDEEIFEADNTIKVTAKNKGIEVTAKNKDIKVTAKNKDIEVTAKNKDIKVTAKNKDIKVTAKNKDIEVTAKNKDINSKANRIDKVVNETLISQDCYVMMKKFESNNTLQKQVVNQNFNLTHNNNTKNNGKSLVTTFWETDFESDAECQTVLPREHVTDILKKANATLESTKQDFKNPIGNARSEISKKSLDVPKHLNHALMNNTVSTFNSMPKLNTSTLTVRSHRTSRKKKSGNETRANETKLILDKKDDFTKDNSEKPAENNIGMTNAKTKNIHSEKSTDIPKSKLNKQNEKNTTPARSTSQSKKSPKEKQPIKDKRPISSKNKNTKTESKSKPEKSCTAINNKKNKTEAQTNKTATKNKANETENENTQVNTKNDVKSKNQNDKQQNKKLKTPKSKPKSDCQNNSMRSKKKDPVSQLTNLNLNNTVDSNTSFRSGRLLRSCRMSNQSRSIELSETAQLNNTSVNMNKTLRSRVINLSSSIENMTIKIKPKNKNISRINTRKSDISFSINTKEHTPVPKKTSARSRAGFFNG